MEFDTYSHYNTIAKAIGFIRENFREQPSLEEIAREVNLSPFHFQKVFTEWAGVSPKQFLQYLNVGYAKSLLHKKGVTLFDAAHETGLSGTGRLHDLFIRIEGMTPGEYKNGGENLIINYSFAPTPFGPVLIASTSKGVCYMAFVEDGAQDYDHLKSLFPRARFIQRKDSHQEAALKVFKKSAADSNEVKLHLRGTAFQLKVWEALLRIPPGGLATYSAIAVTVENARASRAVGSAVGDNPVAFLIPCHRVIRTTGIIGEYHWGTARKAAIIGWEASQRAI